MLRVFARPCCSQARCFATSSSSFPSDAYTKPSAATSSDAVNTTPSDLTESQRKALDSALRVDQAGEIAANYIYMGQKAILGRDPKLNELIQASSLLELIIFNIIQLFAGNVGSGKEAFGGHG